ncbi:MAG TPA: thioredoxin family protein, partial [Puia sp.]
MKYLLIFLLLTGCVAGLHAQQGLFDTYRGWDDLLQKARASDRNIFLYFGAKWCAPCHTLMEKVFPADTVKIKMNSLFVSFAFDADSTNATAFLKKYRITNMPVFLILDRNGFLLNRTETVE